MKKKVLALVLSLVLVIGMLPMTAMAADAELSEAAKAVGKANLVDQLGSADAELYDGESYNVTAVDGEDDMVNVTIDASKVKLHYGVNGMNAYWVGFSVKAPEGAMKVTVNGSGANIVENADGLGNRGVAFYLNADNEELSGKMSYEVAWDDGNPTTYVVYFGKVSVDHAAMEAGRIFSVITSGETNQDNQEVSVELEKDNTIGYYWDVTIDAESLQKSQKEGNGDEEYWTGFAVKAPADAETMKVVAGTAASEVTSLSGEGVPVETDITTEGDKGIAFYVKVTADSEGKLSTDYQWARVQWLDGEGKAISTETYHITLGDVTLAVENVTLKMASVGFKADGAEAKEGVEEDVNALEPASLWTADECGPNTMWGVYKVESITGSATAVLKTSFNGTEFAETAEQSLTESNKGGVSYFEFGKEEQVGSQELQAGVYTFTVYVKDEAGSSLTPVDSMELTVKETRYVLEDGVELGEGVEEELPDYVVTSGNTYSVFSVDGNLTLDLKPVATDEDKEVKSNTTSEENVTIITYTAEEKQTSSGGSTGETEEPEEDPCEDFTDVDRTEWYHKGIDYVVARGLMVGVSPTEFAPDGTTTRAMVVAILYRLENRPVVAGASTFTDVPADKYYADAVAWAQANKIVAGMTETTFEPDTPITREQMAAILYRYAAYKGYDVTAKADLSGYADEGKVSTWATAAMQWAVAEELIVGTSPTTLVPRNSSTRAMTASILMRFCEGIAE